jgi:hypothetical protein
MPKVKNVPLTDEQLLEAKILTDPVYFAEIYLRSPSNPTQPLELRNYQKRILRDKSRKRVFRIGRRVGKSVTIAIEAIWKAYTNKYREVLIVAGYDSQVQTIFNLIKNMVSESPEVSQSIANTRMRPYEIRFKNNSIIMGFVANNAVRGKCLPGDTLVVMSDGITLKEIKDIEIGDKVLSIDTELTDNNSREGTVSAIYDNGIKDIYSIESSSERLIHVTENHKLMAMYKGWVEAKDLNTEAEDGSKSDFVVTIHPDGKAYWTRIQKFKKVKKARTYDITVDKYSNFVAFNQIPDSPGAVVTPYGVDALSSFKIEGLHSGGFLVHNSASDLYIDEVDSIPNNSLVEAVLPIEQSFKHTTITVSGTPSGRREYFYNIVKHKEEMGFAEWYLPASVSPEWSEEKAAQLKLVTTDNQYQHEYLAEFGSMAEGVFKNHFIDQNLYVYGYNNLKFNPNNYYILGVDWNESQFGVQAVILEYMNDSEYLLPYNGGEWKDSNGDPINKIEKSGLLRVFFADSIDPDVYTNIGSVEFIIKLMKKIPFKIMAFDRGHGEANYELLRLSIEKGEGPMGTKCTGMKSFLKNMISVDMGGYTEIIDKVSGTATKAPTKNVMVKNSQLMNETGLLAIPACDLKDQPVEDEEQKLIGQMRGYIIDRVGRHGEVYSSTVREGLDHRLDAFMLGIYAYTMDTSIFHKRSSDLGIENVEGFERITDVKPGWRDIEQETFRPEVSVRNDMTLYDHGFVPRGEPEEYELDKNGKAVPIKQKALFNRSGFKHTSRSIVKPKSRRF